MPHPTLYLILALAIVPLRAVTAPAPAAPEGDVYEGWRQYSVHCARCHGQDVLGNPVAANLIKTAAPGGPVAEEEPFTAIVIEGRLDRGMPAFKDQMTPEQVRAVYHYVRGRAAGEVPPGRPASPQG